MKGTGLIVAALEYSVETDVFAKDEAPKNLTCRIGYYYMTRGAWAGMESPGFKEWTAIWTRGGRSVG